MRIVPALALLYAVALGAQAQAPAANARRERAPLAVPNDLEPAVDVSEPRVAIIDRNEAEAAAAAAATSAKAATPTPNGSAAPAQSSAAPQNAGGTAQDPARAPTANGSAPQTGTPRVLDSLDLGTTSITGNQELPKVLYIVPWKKSDLGDLVGRPVNTLLDEVLTPVDPEVFERHLSYYETLHGKGQQE